MNRFIYGLLFSWIDLFDSVVSVLTLGYYNPQLVMRFACWYALADIERWRKMTKEESK